MQRMILISGASGLVGRAITTLLDEKGLPWKALKHGVDWNREQGLLEAHDAHALIHLAGEPIAAGRWTEERKQEIADSRILGTRALCQSMAKQERPPEVVICASASGFYGNRGEELLRESSERGSGYLADLVRDWEDAAAPLKEAGVRVVQPRLGIVLSKEGGALAKMLPAFRLGLGGPLGNGQAWMSWIHVEDAARFFVHALEHGDCCGAYNLVAPRPVRNRDFGRELGQVLKRPAFMPLPSFMVKVLFGEMGENLLLSSARLLPERIQQETDFIYSYPELLSAFEAEIATCAQVVDKDGGNCE